ncbi:amidohydrolase family protein [Haloferula sp.]|uniref:metal-dependent hydrolase family protein n=1 Tax=Haloferula sp. TaxID=2497595 RepID=UPI00329A9F4B
MMKSKIVVSLAATASLALPLAAQDKKEEEKKTQILITNVSVWDGIAEKPVAADVLIEDNKIKTVGKGIKAAEANVIDGKGGVVTPGLIDMHQHLLLNGGTTIMTDKKDAFVQGAHATRAAEYLLRTGFTTIRDIAGNSMGLKKEVNAGLLPGPRIYSSGGALGPTGGHQDWGGGNDPVGYSDYQERNYNTMTADGPEGVMAAARHNFRGGADFIKMMAGGGVASTFDPLEMTQYSPSEMKAIVEVANEYRSYVAIHAYHDDSYNKAMDAGVKCYEHGFLVSEEVVKRMAKEGVWWSWQPHGSYTTFAGGFPDWFTPDMRRKGAMVYEGSQIVPELMKKHGVKIFLGSDMFGWDNWHNAIVNITTPVTMPKSTFTSLDCMKMATSLPGQALRELTGPATDPFKESKLGVLEEGAWADLLIWKGDPTEDVKLILEEENLLFIMKDGVSFKNLLVEPTHKSFRGGLKSSGHSWSL